MNQKTLCKLAWRIACAVVVQISAVTNSVSALAQEVRTSPTTLPSDLVLTLGKSKIVEVPFIVEKVSVGNPAVADIVVTGPRQVYLLGKAIGSSNLMLWRKGGEVVVIDLSVELDVEQLRLQFSAILPGERALRVHSAADAVVLSGPVSSISRADQAVALADRFVQSFTRSNPGHARVLNLLNVAPAQQVMLEVKVAEVSRAMLDQFGVSLNLSKVTGAMTYGLVTSQWREVFGSLSATKNSNGSRITVDGRFDDSRVKILAEPTIVALSGQEGSFLAGGKVFIPVSRANDAGGATVVLEEKEYGIGLKFTPVVLDGDLIHLRVAPEVSELTRAGSPFVSTSGATSILPSFTTRRAQTSVQLRDGESLAIAGLIKNNLTENVSRFPFLGELPILGPLFRSTEFQADQSELIFLITPHLVRALSAPPVLPTDLYRPPSREDLIFKGKLEGTEP